MAYKKSFFIAPILLLLLGGGGGCKQAEDFTQAEIIEVDQRKPAAFIPFSNASLYLDGTAGTDPALGLDAISLMGGMRLVSFYSFSLWFKMDTPLASGTFFKMDDSLDVEFDLSWEANTKTLKFDHLFEYMGGVTTSNLVTEIKNPQAWNHIVVTCSYNGAGPSFTFNTLKLYHNGNLVQEDAKPSDQIFFGLGRKLEILPDTNKLSPAYIDEMAFWLRDLSSDEVKTLYGEGAPGDLALTHTDVYAWWRFGESGFLPTVDDEIGGRKFTLAGDIELSNDIAIPLGSDPFGGDDSADPLSDDESGDGTSSGGGSDPLEGGSGGFGGELGDGGSSGNFP